MCSSTCSNSAALKCFLTGLLLRGKMECPWPIRHSAKRPVYWMCGRFVNPICRKWHCGYQFHGCKISVKYQKNMMIISDWLGQLCNHSFTQTVGKVGYSRHFFAFSTTATLFQVQTSSKICHTIKQLCIHNVMPKHENNALQKKIYIKWNQYSMLKFMFYHTNIMCL